MGKSQIQTRLIFASYLSQTLISITAHGRNILYLAIITNFLNLNKNIILYTDL